jgi:hypothetical protein
LGRQSSAEQVSSLRGLKISSSRPRVNYHVRFLADYHSWSIWPSMISHHDLQDLSKFLFLIVCSGLEPTDEIVLLSALISCLISKDFFPNPSAIQLRALDPGCHSNDIDPEIIHDARGNGSECQHLLRSMGGGCKRRIMLILIRASQGFLGQASCFLAAERSRLDDG